MSSEIADLNFNIGRILYSKWICETSSAWSRKKTHTKKRWYFGRNGGLGLTGLPPNPLAAVECQQKASRESQTQR